MSSTQFLYSGSNPIQTGVAPGTIQLQQAAVIRGATHKRDGSPLVGATISVLGHPELGQTVSRADGAFDLAVNGGGQLTLNYAAAGYLSAQRQVTLPWQDYALINPAVLVPLDAAVSALDLTAQTPMQVARGSVSADTDGTRQATLMLARGTAASMTLPNGSTQSLTNMHVRATEYTVGSSGFQAMPADLPPTSAYTYAVELTADEAVAAGAASVSFNQPLPFYLENFVGFPVGQPVPVGVYDRAAGVWTPSTNGVVVKILSVTNGTASLDINGSGTAATASQLSTLGVTDAELTQLGSLYPAGRSLWRVPIAHFSTYDFNWPASPNCPPQQPGHSCAPNQPPPCSKSNCPPLDHQCTQVGSSIGCERQDLGELVGVAGTAFTLHYQSDRQVGYAAANTITIPLSGDYVPMTLQRIDVEITVAGQRVSRSVAPLVNQSTTFTWDGRDAYGRFMQGAQRISVSVGYVYQAVYQTPEQTAQTFAQYGGALTSEPGRHEVIVWQAPWRGIIGGWNDHVTGLGGWRLNVEHAYDPTARVLYLGNGEQRTTAALLSDEITTVAGTNSSGYSGDGGPATQARMAGTFGVAVAADGSVLVADSNNGRIWRVDPRGIMTTFAGQGSGFGGDGGPATQALFANPEGIAIAPDGTVYVADTSNHRIRRITPGGIISTFAGNGSSSFSGDGGPATQASLSAPSNVAIGPDGSVYFADYGNARIRKVSPNGIITTVAGNGIVGFSGDGGPAAQAEISNIHGIAVGRDGTLFIGDTNNHRVRQVSPTGLMTTYAGNGTCCFSGDGGLATQASLSDPNGLAIGSDGTLFVAQPADERIRQISPEGIVTTLAGTGVRGYSGDGGLATQATFYFPYDVAVGPDGAVFIADEGNSTIRRIGSAFPAISVGQLTIPSGDGSQLYIFDGGGRHLKTLHALTGAALYTFSHDVAGRLTSIADADGNVTTIQHDANGNPIGIVAPFGQQTSLAVDSSGYLSRLSSPAGNTVQFTSGAAGLLSTLTDARGGVHSFSYDALGRLTKDQEPDGSAKTLVRTDAPNGYQLNVTSVLGRTTTYAVSRLASNAIQRTVTLADGTRAVSVTSTDGKTTLTTRDGTITTFTEGPDPRFGMLAPITISRGVTMPSGLTATTTLSRSVSLTDPSNPFSMTQQTENLSVNGQMHAQVYDAASRTFVSTSPTGRKATVMIDTTGRIVQAQDANLQPVTLTYDAHGRLVATTQGSGTSARTTTYAYDAASNLASVTDPLQRSVSLTYDADGRPLQELLPDGQVIVLGYDPNSNITSLNVPGGHSHTATYTSVDQLSTYAPPDVGIGNPATTYSYDQDRALTQITRPDGSKLSVGYDIAGRPATLTIPTGQLGFSYSPTTGSLASLSAASGESLAYAYDGALRTGVTWSGPVAGSVATVFDNNFRVTSQALNAVAVSFQYDQDGLLTGAGNLVLRRDAQTGLLAGSTLGAVVDSLSLDAFGDPASYTAAAGSTALLSTTSTRDNLGRLTQKTETIGGITTTYAYSYDVRGRLVQVQKNGALLSTYTYDANGNRTSSISSGGTVTGTYDAQDRLLTYGGSTYRYSADGELQSTLTGGQTTTYNYDVLGNLLGVAPPTGASISYVVDGKNRRVGKLINGVLVQAFLYEGKLRPVAELDGSGSVVSRFVYATRPNVPDYLVKGSATYRIITDQLGSPRLVVEVNSGQIAQRIDYDEFGAVIQDTNPGFQPFGFAGGLYDRDTKLVRFGLRDYDPTIGRWTTKDPLGFRGGDTNLYSYAGSDPVNHVDVGGTMDTLTAFCMRDPHGCALLAAEAGGGAAAVNEAAPAIDEAGAALIEAAAPAVENLVCRASTIPGIGPDTLVQRAMPQISETLFNVPSLSGIEDIQYLRFVDQWAKLEQYFWDVSELTNGLQRLYEAHARTVQFLGYDFQYYMK
ncbi:MAG: hypothetical protein NVSMB2_01360 [Chloroflexota bacterium]